MASQLEKSLGVKAGEFTTSELAQIKGADDGPERRRVIKFLRSKKSKGTEGVSKQSSSRTSNSRKSSGKSSAPKKSSKPVSRPRRSAMPPEVTTRKLSNVRGGRGTSARDIAAMADMALKRVERANAGASVPPTNSSSKRVPGRAIPRAISNWWNGEGETDPAKIVSNSK